MPSRRKNVGKNHKREKNKDRIEPTTKLPSRYCGRSKSLIIRPLPFELSPRYNLTPSHCFDPKDNSYFRISGLDPRDAATNDALLEYERIADIIEEIISGARKPYLLTLLTRRKYPSNQHATPSIYITCAGVRNIKGKLQAIPTWLRIEAHEGTVGQLHTMTQWKQHVEPGLSIGVKGDAGSGTFGGWVKDSEGRCFGVTCGHVAASHLRGTVTAYPMRLRSEQCIPLVQPSDTDATTTRKKLMDDLTDINKLAAIADKKNNDTGGTIESVRKRLENWRAQVDSVQTNLHNIQGIDRDFGYVKYATVDVIQDTDGQYIWKDTALIEVPQERIGRNIISDVPGRTTSFDIRGHTTPQPNMKVLKVGGRTTGTLPGYVSIVKARVAIQDKLCRNKKLYHTRETLILPEISSPILGYSLAEAGDSGSLIVTFDEDTLEYRVVGQLFAGIERYVSDGIFLGDVAIITSAEKLISWWAEDMNLNLEFGT